ncbi:MAG: metallophosphoesterase [Cyclobacteriaceae bacterium]|nr:metallophosphoesterase [Cyclobacteriaceae bacterium]MCH8517328.1 metallophosphoesterase [Cyclobacteriaceae bacterium]
MKKPAINILNAEMKILSIGDLHGKTLWQSFVDIKEFDHIIFMGDYVDDERIPDIQIIENLREIIAFKCAHPEKVSLLLGNHDMQYLDYPNHRCSKFNHRIYESLVEIYNQNRSLFDFSFGVHPFLWTHAGISIAWWDLIKKNIVGQYVPQDTNDFNDFFNILYKNPHLKKYLFSVGEKRGGNQAGGILWADIAETSTNYLEGIHQICGHNQVPEIISVGDDSSGITYIDCLNSSCDFFELQIDDV